MIKAAFCVNCNLERPTVLRRLNPQLRGDRVVGKKTRICIVCRKPVELRNKYNAKPALGTTGKMRHSSGEAAYESMLAWQAKLGEIEDLRLCNDPPHETYSLDVYGTPAVRALLEEVELMIASPTLVRLAREVRCSLAPIGSYTPDFSYRRKGERQRRVVDTKGYADREFSRTRKLMRACQGIDVEVVTVPREVLKTFGVRRSA